MVVINNIVGNISASMGKLKIWTPEEDRLLVAVSGQNLSKKWKRAAQELRDNGYHRTDIQCRERFVNHLDPSVSKGSWTDQELQTLYEKYGQVGNKWFLLQRHLPGRTQTKIKNYFYGNVRYLLKIVVKTVTDAKAGFINDIKTDTLLDLYEGRNSFQGIRLVKQTIQRLHWRVDRKIAQRFVKENHRLFQEFAMAHVLRIGAIREGINRQGLSGSSDPSSEEEGPRVAKMASMEDLSQMEPVEPVRVACSVAGVPSYPEDELEYLSRMALMHEKWFTYYSKCRQSLLQQGKSLKLEGSLSTTIRQF